MAIRTYTGFGSKVTPQSEPIPGSEQVVNSAGGYSFALDNWKRLDRFLILGSEGGTYYIKEHALARENASVVEACLKEDGARTVETIVAISEAGRAPKNDPALFALAMAASLGDDATRKLALDALPRVARIGTHLMHFAAFVDQFRGWGRGLRRAIAHWYFEKSADDLAYQLVKYQSRDKWSHRDLLRLAHPHAAQRQAMHDLFKWAVDGWPDIGPEPPIDSHLRLIWAFEKAKRKPEYAELVKLIREYRLPREAVPTEALGEKIVWQALLDEPMPMTAMIRNLATMTRVGLLGPMQPANAQVVSRLGDEQALRRARVHPIQILSAMHTYQQGHGERGNNTWTPAQQIIDALDGAFYKAFQNVTPTNKRIVLALDISGSMGWSTIAGVPGLTPRVGSAAMALVTAATEPNYVTVAFTAASVASGSGITPVDISPRQRLDDVLKKIDGMHMGGTDCALPMLWALENKVAADAFVIYTDSETWAGTIHPVQALRQYREKTGIPAKLIVVGMVSNGFSIADPNDAGMLDVAGFDTATPAVLADFIRA